MTKGSLDDAPLRVMHVSAPGRIGGLETVLVQLTAGLQAHGHDVRVATVLPPGSELAHPVIESLKREGVTVHPVLVHAREYRAECRAIRSLIEEHDVQILHTHGYRSDVLHGGVAKSLKRAQVTTLHGFTGGTRRMRVYEWLQVWAAGRADAVIAVSQPIVERLANRDIVDDVHLIRNASTPCRDEFSRDEARRLLSIPQFAPIVGWVGRVSPEKGPEVFVEALSKTDAAVHGVIVGDGPMLAGIRALAEARGVSTRLHCVGAVPQASRYLSAFDMLALTSHTEGTPMILLEAMWAGVPILATAVGGVPDLISPDCALLCAPDDVVAIAEAIEAYLTKPELRRQMSQGARERVERHFGANAWLNEHERVYRMAMNRAGR